MWASLKSLILQILDMVGFMNLKQISISRYRRKKLEITRQ